MRKDLTALLLGASALLPAAALAQQAPAAESGVDDSGIADIVVTAQKRSESLNKVGLTISALSADDLARQRVSTLADVAAAVPGLSYNVSSNNTPVFTLRGIGFYETSIAAYPTVSVYLDEIPLPLPILSTLTAFDLERIEVLKGPQGTLFGQNSTGGAVNYIAAKPTDHFVMGGDISYGRFNMVEGNGYVGGPLGPNLRARLSGRIAHSSDWQKSYTRNDTTGATESYAGRLLVDWDASDRVRFRLNLNAWKDKTDPLAQQYTFPLPQQPAFARPDVLAYPTAPERPRAADWSPNTRPRANNRFYQAALRGEWDLSDDVTLTSISSYIDFKLDQVPEGDGMAFNLLDVDTDTGYIRSFSQELRLSNGAGGPFRWVLGGNLERTNVYERAINNFRDSSTFPALGIARGGFSSRQKLRNYAGFANAEYEVSSRLTVKAGGRYTQSNRSATNCSFDADGGLTNAFFTTLSGLLSGQAVPALGPGDCFTMDANFRNGPPIQGKLNQNNLSWRVGVDFKASDRMLLYANVAKGYKAGSFPNYGAATYLQYIPVRQESVLAYEAGVKFRSADRRFQANAAAFYYDYRDKQLKSKLIDPVFGLNDALVNIPKSRVKGAEIDMTMVPTSGLTIRAAATFTDAKVQRYVGVNAAGVIDDFAGANVPFTPKWQVQTSADYSWDMGGVSPFVGGTISMRDDAYSIVGGERVFFGGRQLYAMDGYALVDLRAGIAAPDDSWRVSLFGRNVFNKYYIQNVVTASDSIVRYPGRPATYGVTVAYKFR